MGIGGWTAFREQEQRTRSFRDKARRWRPARLRPRMRSVGTAVLPEASPPDHSTFSHPREVVPSQAVPVDQKRRILLDWLQDELALIVAENEGMMGGRPPRLDQVLAALRDLDQASEVWRRTPWPAR